MKRRLHLALGIVLAASACSPSATSPDGAVSFDGSAAGCVDDGLVVALASRYAIQARLVVNLRVPAGCDGDTCILDTDARAGVLLLAEVAQSGRTAALEARACRLDIPPVALKGQLQPTEMHVPNVVMRSLAPVTAVGTLGGDTTCAPFSSDLIPIPMGFRLRDVIQDPLPAFHASAVPPVKLCDGTAASNCAETQDRGCICDQEGDGEPGASLEASGVPALDDVDRVYVGLRVLLQLDGQVFPASAAQATQGPRLEGTIRSFALEQSPVGCRRTAAGGAGSAHDCEPLVVDAIARLNPEHRQSIHTPSTFLALPVDAEMDCDRLETAAESLFP